jgi:hypothetical protein
MADPKLARDARLVIEATAWQVSFVLLDAATMWVFIRSAGATASPAGVFTSFMIASMIRTARAVQRRQLLAADAAMPVIFPSRDPSGRDIP